MRYARVEAGIVREVAIMNYEPDPPESGQWVEDSAEAAQPGGGWDGATFSAPTPSPRMRLSVREFREQFTEAEKQAIYTAAKTSVAVEVWLDDLRSVTYVDLDFPQTVASVQGLESAGLIASGRAAEILAGVS